MPKIRAVIFDMDGVLVEAKDWHYAALNRALGLFGMEISRYDHLVTYDGLPTRNKLQMLSAERGLPHDLHDFINEIKQQYTMEIIHAECKPVFYHEYALSNLKREGYKLAVASNSVRRTVEAMMEHSALNKYLDLHVSNEDVTAAKPDPEIYLLAMDKLGVGPHDCLIVEDNDKGIQAARASGGWVMEVGDVHDVTFENIKRFIDRVEGESV